MEISEIIAAFKDVPKGEVGLRTARALDDNLDFDSPKEFEKIKKTDVEDSWQKISDELIESHHDALFFLDASGLKFVLPAFMVWSLKDRNICEPSADSLFFLLSESSLCERPERVKNEWKLTKDQVRLVNQWLDFYLSKNPNQAVATVRKRLAQWKELV